MPLILSIPNRHWECPNCDLQEVTPSNVTNRFHNCPGLRGLTAPMVPEGTRCKVEANVREDYIGRESVQMDGEDRPVMSVVTTRDDGQDCAVFAPVAQVRGDV